MGDVRAVDAGVAPTACVTFEVVETVCGMSSGNKRTGTQARPNRINAKFVVVGAVCGMCGGNARAVDAGVAPTGCVLGLWWSARFVGCLGNARAGTQARPYGVCVRFGVVGAVCGMCGGMHRRAHKKTPTEVR